MMTCYSDHAAEARDNFCHAANDDITVDETADMSTRDQAAGSTVHDETEVCGQTSQPEDGIHCDAVVDDTMGLSTQDPADNAADEAGVSSEMAQHGDDDKTGVLMGADSGDTVADETSRLSTQDQLTDSTVDPAAGEAEVCGDAAQHGDEIPSDALMHGEATQMDSDVQPDDSRTDEKRTWYFADIKQQWRKFNIDLMPKVVICDSMFVHSSVTCYSNYCC